MSGGRLRDKWGLLRSRQLRKLFFARTISSLGDMITPVALAFAVLHFAGSAAALGTVLAARAVPSLVLMLLGGVVGDRYPRRTIMVISNLMGFGTQGLIGLLLLTGKAEVWSVALLTAIRGATGSFFNPASTGAIAQVAPEGRKQESFALFSIAGNIAEVSGPALAGITLMLFEPGWLLVADALTFLVSALLISTLGPIGNPAGVKKRSVFTELREGFRYVRLQKWLTVLILSASLFQFFLLPSLNVLGPLVANQHLGGASAWAVIATALGAGGIAGSFLAMMFKPKRPLMAGYLLLLLGAGPTLFLLAIPASVPYIALSEFVAGLVISFFTALEYAAVSQHVPGNLMSRVDSINRFGSMALRPVGMALVGPVAAACGVQVTLVVAGAVSLLAVAWPLTVRSVRNLNMGAPTADSATGAANESG